MSLAFTALGGRAGHMGNLCVPARIDENRGPHELASRLFLADDTRYLVVQDFDADDLRMKQQLNARIFHVDHG